MAMLAEQRKRYKWVFNPRGQDWVNDDTKFGQKLMEKMGWSKGKGLGREEQGDVDHVEVHVKNNTKGIGYKVTDDAWIKHYEGFESVLASLNKETNGASASPNSSAPNSNLNSDDEDSKVTSLEALSKTSQARVHYHKFTRGKDLSQLNPDDIASITGSKRAKRLAEIAKKEDFQEDKIGHTQHNGGLTTIKGGNIKDYFAKKLAAIKGKTSQSLDTSETCASAELQDEIRETACGELDLTVKKKEKKKRKKGREIDDEMLKHSNMCLQECEEECTEEKSRVDVVDENEDAEGKNNFRPKMEENADHSQIEVSSKEQRENKKKKKARIYEENDGEGIRRISDDSVAVPKKKKKSKKIFGENEVEVQPTDESACVFEEYGVVDTEREEEKIKKKKKKKRVSDCMEEYKDEEIIKSSSYQEEPPKKKKKSKSVTEKEGIEREFIGEKARSLDESGARSGGKKDDRAYFANDVSENESSKKKKRKHELHIEVTEDNEVNTLKEINVGQLKHKKKKKSKNKES